MPLCMSLFAPPPETIQHAARLAASGQDLSSLIEAQLGAYFAAHAPDLPPAGVYDRVIRLVEEALLRRTLLACAGNQLMAARVLGINRNTLRTKCQQFGLNPQELSQAALVASIDEKGSE